jgi:hypothetical protein
MLFEKGLFSPAEAGGEEAQAAVSVKLLAQRNIEER